MSLKSRIGMVLCLGAGVVIGCKLRQDSSLVKQISSFPSLMFPIALADGPSSDMRARLKELVDLTSVSCRSTSGQGDSIEAVSSYIRSFQSSFGSSCIPGTLDVDTTTVENRGKLNYHASACCFKVN